MNENENESEEKLTAKNRKKYFRRIAVRMTEREHAGLTDRAKKAGLSLSRYLIKAGLSDGQVLTADEREEIRQLRHEVRRAGINLNQIARSLNAWENGQSQPPPMSEIEETTRETGKVLKSLLRLIK